MMFITRKMIKEFEKEKAKIIDMKEKINNYELVLKEWRKIGEYFISNGLMVWGDILPLKSLDIIKKMEKENTQLRWQLKSIPDVCPICNKGIVLKSQEIGTDK